MVVVFVGGVALAAAPVKGALYTGAYNTGGTLSFHVSANGKEVKGFQPTYPGPTCLAAPPAPSGQHARIRHGRFTVRITPGWTLTGRFLAHGKVKGTWKYTRDCQFPIKVVKQYQGTWSASTRR